jgi:hypothetical protein
LEGINVDKIIALTLFAKDIFRLAAFWRIMEGWNAEGLYWDSMEPRL